MSDTTLKPSGGTMSAGKRNWLIAAIIFAASVAGSLVVGEGSLVYEIFVSPFLFIVEAPDLFVQVIWEGLVAGTLYALLGLGFVLIFKASGVFNFAQGIMVVFGALSLVGFYAAGIPAFLSLLLSVAMMYVLAWTVERVVLRPLVNQDPLILFMATIGLTYFLIGFGEFIFGGEPKVMITEEIGLPSGSYNFDFMGGFVSLQKLDIAAAVIAAVLVGCLAVFFNKTKVGRALRAVADDHQAALSVGITLRQIWVIVWFAAGIVALTTGIMWGARSDVSFALQIIALKALPVIILGGLTSIPGAIIGGLIIGISEKLAEFYWGPLVGGSIESWIPYFIALGFLWFRPQGLFGEKIIDRI
jgi:branched-chain amino acid transport system permease protein